MDTKAARNSGRSQTGRQRLVLFIALAGHFDPAVAQESPPLSNVESADVHQVRANQLFQDQKYAAAARELEQVYLLEPRPLYLFNIAQAYRRAGQPIEALAAYQRFLTVAPKHPLANEAGGYVQDMRALVAAQERARAEEQQSTQTLAELSRERAQKDQMARLLKQEQQRRAFYKRPWFWGAVGGVVAVTLGVGLGVGLYERVPPTEGGFMSIHF